MQLNQLSRAVGRAPAQRFTAGARVSTPDGRGKVEATPRGADIKYLVRLDRPHELRNGNAVERSAYFAFELEAA